MLVTLLLLCLGLHCTVCLDLSHLDREMANRICGLKSSCELGRGSRFGDDLDWRDRNCLCDKQCTRYGDCCLDSPHFDDAEQRRGAASFSCVDLQLFGGIYMMTSCPPSWGNPQVRAMCEIGRDNLKHPISVLPVTSHNSSITYRNSYCALCHHDEKHLEFWRLRLECSTLSIQHNLTGVSLLHLLIFNKTENSWGLTFNNTFYGCSIYPVLPEKPTLVIRRCQADTIKTCAVNWTNTDVRNSCEAYTSMIYVGNVAYRNPHCAVCNNVPLQDLECIRSQLLPSFSPVAFAVLFDFSRGISQVGKIQPCNESQLYDPFFKKCRDVIT